MRRTLEERLAAKMQKGRAYECWLFMGCIAGRGYGGIQQGGKMLLAHRAAFELANGPIPAGTFICHTCDNRRCVNPAHLYAGTPQQNMDDKVARGRQSYLSGESNGCAKLTTGQVLAIRTARAGGAKQRELAAIYGVGQTQISKICIGKRWKQI